MRGWVIQIECLHFLNPFPEQISNYGIFHKGKDDDLFVFVLRVCKEKHLSGTQQISVEHAATNLPLGKGHDQMPCRQAIS